MTTKKLMMFVAAGLLAPGLGTASAEINKLEIIKAPVQDLAPVNGQGRLQRTNEEQAGNEDMSIVLLGPKQDKGLAFAMTTELTNAAGAPVRANNRVQLSLTPFALQKTMTGGVEIAPVAPGASKFVTNNDGNEYRNCNHSEAFAVGPNNELGCVLYNYQPNNDTIRYMQCFTADGTRVMNQTQIFAKNNDDAAMTRSGGGCMKQTATATETYLGCWFGANGNGRDDGWYGQVKISHANLAAPTAQKMFDVSLAPREERSHGNVSFGLDKNTAIATWTEGNNQPQRDGVWMAAIDTTPGKFNGANQQGSILWKQMLEGRLDTNVGGQQLRTYSMRIDHMRVLGADLQPTNNIITYWNALRGNNNENQKGGTAYQLRVGVITATKEGMKYVTPVSDISGVIKGIGGTHLAMNHAVFGTSDKLVPGLLVQNGSHTGGGFDSEVRAVSWDMTANKFVDLGKQMAAPLDRHLYSNYLGNNPGNQGRNYNDTKLIVNPFRGEPGQTASHLAIIASTGKSIENKMDARIKLSGFLTVMPVAQDPVAPPTQPTQDPQQPNPTPDPANPPQTDDPATPEDESIPADTTLGGCSTSGSTGGLVTFLLIGLAAFIRRRR